MVRSSSGPSFCDRASRTFSRRVQASRRPPGRPVRHAQVVQGDDRIGVIGPEGPHLIVAAPARARLMASSTSPASFKARACWDMIARVSAWSGPSWARADRQGLREQGPGLGGVAQGPVGPAQPILQPGHDEGVADGVSLQVGGRPVEPIPEDRPQRPAFLLLRPRVEVREDRAEDVDPALDLCQSLLGRLLGPTLARSCLLGPHQPDRRADDAGEQQEEEEARPEYRPPVPPEELGEAVAGRRRTGFHRFVRQIVLDVPRQPVRRLVPTGTVLLQALHDDPVQLAPHQPGQSNRLELSLCRQARQRVAAAQPALGRGGSSSLISRSISCQAASWKRCLSTGVVPVSNSYRITPSA